MNREIHVRFWEGLGVRFPRATLSPGWLTIATQEWNRVERSNEPRISCCFQRPCRLDRAL